MSDAARRLLVTAGILALAAVSLITQYEYLLRSSSTKRQWQMMLTRLTELEHLPLTVPVMLDVPELGRANIAALYARGHVTAKYSGDTILGPVRLKDVARLDVSSSVRDLARQAADAYRRHVFPLGRDDAARHEFFRFEFPANVDVAHAVVVTAAADESVVNNSEDRPRTGRYFIRPIADVRNHLAQVDSNLAHAIYPGIIDNVALWQRELDFAGPGGLQAIGRHLLFEVINPVPGSRLLFDFTTGARYDLALPPATIIGEQRVELDLVGRGAARVLSEPITPMAIDGRFYIAIDMRAEPRRILRDRRGLMALYNRHLNLDPRSVVGFIRNISLVTDDQISIPAPPSIQSIPAGLFQPGLLFSGVYEDGWMADIARFKLGSRKDSRLLRIKGYVPGFNPRLAAATLKVLVDGEQVAQRQISAGDFELEAIIPSANGPRWIELRVAATDRLSADDSRIASILLRSIALEAAD
jgi:hypothetical protein